MTSDKTDKPGVIEAIKAAIQAETAKIRTVVPGRVVAYDHTEQKATVQPKVRSSYRDPEDGSRQTYLPEPIPNCPIAFPSSSNFSITWPLEKGDPVELRFASRSLDEWLTGGGDDVTPQDTRRHDISDPVVWPGVRSFAEALGTDRRDSGAMVLYGEEIHLGSADSLVGGLEYVALANKVEQEIQDIWDALEAHTHQVMGVKPGPQNKDTEVPNSNTASQGADLGSAGSVASDKVKAK